MLTLWSLTRKYEHTHTHARTPLYPRSYAFDSNFLASLSMLMPAAPIQSIFGEARVGELVQRMCGFPPRIITWASFPTSCLALPSGQSSVAQDKCDFNDNQSCDQWREARLRPSVYVWGVSTGRFREGTVFTFDGLALMARKSWNPTKSALCESNRLHFRIGLSTPTPPHP